MTAAPSHLPGSGWAPGLLGSWDHWDCFLPVHGCWLVAVCWLCLVDSLKSSTCKLQVLKPHDSSRPTNPTCPVPRVPCQVCAHNQQQARYCISPISLALSLLRNIWYSAHAKTKKDSPLASPRPSPPIRSLARLGLGLSSFLIRSAHPRAPPAHPHTTWRTPRPAPPRPARPARTRRATGAAMPAARHRTVGAARVLHTCRAWA